MNFVYSDGGRSKYFKTKNAGDYVIRAIYNTTIKDYKVVYDELNLLGRKKKKLQINKKVNIKQETEFVKQILVNI